MKQYIDQQLPLLEQRFGPIAIQDDGDASRISFSMDLPDGWNRGAVEIEFIAASCYPLCNPADFYARDAELRLSHGGYPRHASPSERGIRFLLRPDHWNPNLDTLLTYAYLIRRRFQNEDRDGRH